MQALVVLFEFELLRYSVLFVPVIPVLRLASDDTADCSQPHLTSNYSVFIMSRTTRKPKMAVKANKEQAKESVKSSCATAASSSRSSRLGKTAAKNLEGDVAAAMTIESKGTSMDENRTLKEPNELAPGKHDRATCDKDGGSNKENKTTSAAAGCDENTPPPSSKRPRRSNRAAALHNRSLYAESDGDSSPTGVSVSGDEDESVVKKVNKKTRSKAGTGKVAGKQGRVVTKLSVLGETMPTQKPTKSAKRAGAISATSTPSRGRAALRKPSPASSSIKDITSSMWQPNASDWRVEGVMDY